MWPQLAARLDADKDPLSFAGVETAHTNKGTHMPASPPHRPTMRDLIDWAAICEGVPLVVHEMTRAGRMNPAVEGHPALGAIRVFVQERWGTAARLDRQRCLDLRDLLRVKRGFATEKEADRFRLDQLLDAIRDVKNENVADGHARDAPGDESHGPKNRKKKRGRPVDSDKGKDKKLYDDWQAAKSQGVRRREFAAGKSMTLPSLVEALDRERHRRNNPAL